MQAPPLPLDEERRLDSLRALGLLDTPAEERFDRITRLALRLFAVRFASISLVDARRVYFKSLHGLPFAQIAREASFCGHTIVADDFLIVNDTHRDPRFRGNPLVNGTPNIRFYAGAPLSAEDGSAVAVLALYDVAERPFAAAERDTFSDLARIAESELRHKRFTAAQYEIGRRTSESSRIDPLTRLWNRAAALDILDRELTHAAAEESAVTVLLIDVDQMNRFNESHGHAAGDAALTEVARIVRSSLRPYDSIARFGGEEFLALLPGVDHEQASVAAERIRLAILKEARHDGERLSVTIGGASVVRARVDRSAIVLAAEAAMRVAKSDGGNAVYVRPVA